MLTKLKFTDRVAVAGEGLGTRLLDESLFNRPRHPCPPGAEPDAWDRYIRAVGAELKHLNGRVRSLEIRLAKAEQPAQSGSVPAPV